MDKPQALLELVGALMRVMLVSERTPREYQHAVPYNALDFQTIGVLRVRGGLRARELTDFLGVAPTTTSSVIARLTKRGLIERRRSTQDGRAVSLHLSDAGRELAQTIYAQDIKNMELFLSELTPAEQNDLIALLGKVAGTVGAMASKG